MEDEVKDPAQIIFPVQIQPGNRAGTWQATLNGSEGSTATVIDFMGALELLRWLETSERGSAPTGKGLR